MWNWLSLFVLGFCLSSLFAWRFFKSRYETLFTSQMKLLEQKNKQQERHINDLSEKNKQLEKKQVVLISENTEYLDRIATFETKLNTNQSVKVIKGASELSSVFEKSQEITGHEKQEIYNEQEDFNNRIKVDDFNEVDAVLETDFSDVEAALSINAKPAIDFSNEDDSLLQPELNGNSDTIEALDALSSMSGILTETETETETETNQKESAAKTITTPYYNQYKKQKADINYVDNGQNESKTVITDTEKTDVKQETDNNNAETNATLKVEADSHTTQNSIVEQNNNEKNNKTDLKHDAKVEFDKVAAKTAMGKNIKQDDLKVVEGIGPKIAQLFIQADINTWQALADASVEDCKAILTEAGSRYKMHNPTTWPEQSALAAKGDWKALATLQQQLKGGRRS